MCVGEYQYTDKPGKSGISGQTYVDILTELSSKHLWIYFIIYKIINIIYKINFDNKFGLRTKITSIFLVLWSHSYLLSS